MESLPLCALIFIFGLIIGWAVTSTLGNREKNPPSSNEFDNLTHETLNLFGSPELAPLSADPKVMEELLKGVPAVTDLGVPMEPFDWSDFLKAQGLDPDVDLLAGTKLTFGDTALEVIAELLKAVAVVTDPEVTGELLKAVAVVTDPGVTGEFLKAVAVVTDPGVIAELLRAVIAVTHPELKAELLKALAVVADAELKAELLKAVAVVTAQR